MGTGTIFLKIIVDGNQILGESQSVGYDQPLLNGVSLTNRRRKGAAPMGYEDQIEIDSFSWSTEAKITPDTKETSGYAVKLEQRHLKLTKAFDRSSGMLCKVAAAEPPRKKFTSALLTMVTVSREGTEKNHKVLQLLLEDGFIEEVSLDASEGSNAIELKETVTLSFSKSQFRYFPMSLGDQAPGARSAKPQMTFDHDFSASK